MQKQVLNINSVSFTYPGRTTEVDFRTNLTVFKSLSFIALQGDRVALVGRSGIGKTTFLKLCAGLIQPDSGTVSVEGVPVAHAQKQGLIGYIPQFPAMLNWKSVLDNVLWPTALKNGSVSKKDSRGAMELLDLLGISSKFNRLPSELSGGELERVSLARGLAAQAQLLLIDEPFSRLDDQTRSETIEVFSNAVTEVGKKTIIFVSHKVREARMLCNSCIEFSNTPVEIKKLWTTNSTSENSIELEQLYG